MSTIEEFGVVDICKCVSMLSVWEAIGRNSRDRSNDQFKDVFPDRIQRNVCTISPFCISDSMPWVVYTMSTELRNDEKHRSIRQRQVSS